MSFDSLGLRAELLSAIAAQGYTTPTPIQSEAIPVIFEGCDLLAGAQTGTGKTAAFALPIVQMLGENIPVEKRRRPRALVLVPTRELAAQVSEQMNNYARRLSLRSTMIYGGVTIQAQIERLHRGVDIVVATPGRLLDHAERGTINLSRIKFLVLDEADRMLDLGFIDDIVKVAEYLPPKRQTLLFSATYSQSIKQLADELLDKPRRIEVERKNITADAVIQTIYEVEKSRKREMLSHLIRSGGWQQVLVFARTRYGADKLTEELLYDGIKAAAIHSNKSQSIRTRTLAEFKRGEWRVLVATDVAARGLDIERLPQVVNYDLPQVPEDYVHRIGRTGRAGEDGVALSLVAPEERPLLVAIEKLLKYAIPRKTLAEFPQYASRRSVKTKEAKQVKEQVKARKSRDKVQQDIKAAVPRRKKAVAERPAPKTGRRGRRA
ncbi:DEAD/DEAH box helicase [Geobacter pelophilus]|jgi:ATP-dependent RNA helicase RhlE|uniref:DEAD-box ATP-dependent RNA helicase RhpA n=1 Tax=Geoanaerobacter pelophilus TaxID=60036 RepID=A0AAW4LA08_9BACT|nr:DEAD/DEAH box helicase [Geoanaerobacter pelophilus]MBT0665903.1 DEAD/DEAH box helicase [Geoanaerobacter pelophilus]